MPALKGPKPALDFGKAGLEGLPRPGNPGVCISGLGGGGGGGRGGGIHTYLYNMFN